MTYLLVRQHYSVVPTRNASRWKREYSEVILETESLEEAAKVREENFPDPPGVDVFLKIRKDDGEYRTPIEILDKYYKLRRQFRTKEPTWDR